MKNTSKGSSLSIVLALMVISVYLLVVRGDSLSNEELALKKNLAKLCRNINSIVHLSDMQNLINVVKSIKALPVRGHSSPQPPSSGGWTDYLILPDTARPCLEQADSILDLEPLINERRNVCQLSHIQQIEDYKIKYLPSTTMPSHRITKQFFKLYSNQVAFNCKHNLIHSLHLANAKLPKGSYVEVMPWLASDSNAQCRTAVDQSGEVSLVETEIGRQLGSEPVAVDPDTSSLRCEAIEALSSVKSIHQLVEVMEHDFGESPQQADNTRQEDSNIRNSLILIIPDNDMRKTVEDMLEACSKFEKIYSQTIIPIVRLIQMGYNPVYKKFDDKCRGDTLAQRWFSITLICNSMLRSRVTDQSSQSEFQENLDDNKTGVIVVNESQDDKMLNDKHKGAAVSREAIFSNPIENELWVGKYLPGRFKKFKSRYVEKLIKAFRIDKLRENVVFQKNVERGKSLIVTLILVGLTLLGINSSNL